MNSLEYIRKKISKKIKTINEKRNFMINCKNMNIPFNPEITYEDQKELEYLRQIESELEAWYELNKLFIIKPYYQDKENNKNPAIMVQHAIEHDFEYVRRGVKQESFDKFIKALEVKENDR